MKKILGLFTLLSCTLILGACSDSEDSDTSVSTSSTLKTEESSSMIEVPTTQSSEESTASKIDKLNENWYASDSKYATMEPVKKTVQMQMDELNTDDAVRAIVVNNIQNYLYDSGTVAPETEITPNEINQKLDYSRSGLFIDIRYDGTEPNQDMIQMITDDLLNISGHKYTIE
ncbi:hypothetical protein [Enterococcus sp. AZ163]|uniref:hypothetical protein n=1 Tax=Enterococcus sp. AZ163 TaxID=2774638 RepID=UPI003D2C3262